MEKENKLELSIPLSFFWKTALVVLLLFFVFLIRNVLTLLFLAFIGVSAAQPLVDRLEKRKIHRSVSAGILFFLILLLLAGLVYSIVPVFILEIKELSKNGAFYFQKISDSLPFLVANSDSQEALSGTGNLLGNFSENFSGSFGGIFSNALSFLQNILSLAVIFSLAFYMLVKKDGVQGFLKNIVPKKNRPYVFGLVARIQNQMGRWLIGQFGLVLTIFCLDYAALFFLKVPYALVLAFFGGIMEIIPYVGPILAVIPAILVGLTVSPLTALLVLILYIVIQQMENHIVVPLIMKKAVGLDPVVIILSLLIGGTLLGFLGILAAVPFAAALNIFLGDFLENQEPEVAEEKVINKINEPETF